MTLVARTSLDGISSVLELEIESTTYDLPPWITKSAFKFGLQAKDETNPLASLRSCKLAKWIDNEENIESYSDKSTYSTQAPIFRLEFFVPLDSLRELASGYFAPVPIYAGGSFETTINEHGVSITFMAKEHFGCNTIEAAVLPLNFATMPELNEKSQILAFYKELQANLANAVISATAEGGSYEEFTTATNDLYFFLLRIHEDKV